MENRQDENMLTIEDLVKVLDRHKNTLSNWVKDGTLPEPKVRKGKKRYWFWWQIKQFVGKPSQPISDNSGQEAN